jgi:hypothetical protein
MKIPMWLVIIGALSVLILLNIIDAHIAGAPVSHNIRW